MISGWLEDMEVCVGAVDGVRSLGCVYLIAAWLRKFKTYVANTIRAYDIIYLF